MSSNLTEVSHCCIITDDVSVLFKCFNKYKEESALFSQQFLKGKYNLKLVQSPKDQSINFSCQTVVLVFITQLCIYGKKQEPIIRLNC